MDTFTLGRTGLVVSRTGFGALPIQRISKDEAKAILLRAYEGGINYFDTARAYTDSEEKIGYAFEGIRNKIYLATKTAAKTAEGFWKDLETSLEKLKTDHIDVYQFHNPPFVPMPGGEDGLYDAALKAREMGKIRFISITQHSIDRAFEAVNSGLYDTVQYPFNHLASDRDIELVNLCKEKNVGFIAMKALSGGLVTNAAIPYAFLRSFENVIPIWGVQRMSEMEQILGFENDRPVLDEEMQKRIDADRSDLVGAFCRSCGYCMPCPVGIPINNANRMTQLITRSPSKQWMTQDWQDKMSLIEKCTKCGACAKKCPYGLKPYETMPGHLAFYRAYVEEHKND